MRGLVAFNLWQWIEENRATFEPPVGNKVIWEDSQFTAMVVRGPNARRDFHVDPSDEIFYMLRGAMRLEYMVEDRRREQIITDIQGKLQQQMSQEKLFSIRWTLA